MTDAYSIDTSVSKQIKKHSTKRLTTEIFTERAKAVHGSTYCYDLVVYKNTKSKVDISCELHGVFSQFAGDHMAGSGCPKCMNRISNADFIMMCRAVHGNKYDYSLCKYTDSREKVNLICNTCNSNFWQISQSHIRGRGCSVCANKSERGTADFIKESVVIHGETYDYSKVDYKNNYSNVILGCKVHGFFSQIARNHLRGNGCPSCASEQGAFNKTNFLGACERNNNGVGTLYVIKCSLGDEVFFKVGITSRTVEMRFYGKGMPYSYDSVHLIHGGASFIFDLEVRLRGLLKEYKYKPDIDFAGQTECFTSIKPVDSLLRRLSSTQQLQLIA